MNIDVTEARLALREGGGLGTARTKVENALACWAYIKRARGMANTLDLLGDDYKMQGQLDQALEQYIAALCLYPFEQQPMIHDLWEKIELTVHEIIREPNRPYYDRF